MLRRACSTARCKGFFARRREPGGRDRELGAARARRCAKLDWLVVRDLVEIETAAFWYDGPEIETGELRDRGHRHRGVLPAGRGAHREGRHASPTPSGCCSGTTRRSSRPATAAPSCGSSTTSAAGSASGCAGSAEPRDRPLLDLTWDYPLTGPARRARRRGGAAGDQRPRRRRRVASPATSELAGRRLDQRAAPGSTPASTPTA